MRINISDWLKQISLSNNFTWNSQREKSVRLFSRLFRESCGVDNDDDDDHGDVVNYGDDNDNDDNDDVDDVDDDDDDGD